MCGQLLWLVDCQVSDCADVLLDPVQILTHQLFLFLIVVTQYQISIRYFPDLLQALSQWRHMQIYQRHVVPQCHILERQTVVPLHQKHILLKQLMNQFLWLNHRTIVIQCIYFSHVTTAWNFTHPCVDLGLTFVSLCQLLLLNLLFEIAFVFLSCSQNRLLDVYVQFYQWWWADDLDPFFEILVFKWKAVNNVSVVGVLGKDCLKMCNNLSQWDFLAVFRRN